MLIKYHIRKASVAATNAYIPNYSTVNIDGDSGDYWAPRADFS